ncbi:MAG: Lrp/AsnC ligand binding domain-containing protein [Bacteroidota bacterium]
MSPSNYEIDNVDRQILQLLMENTRLPFTEIAQKVHVSPGTVHVRVKKMEEAGIIEGSQLSINPTALGYDVTAFLGVFLIRSALYDQVLEQLREIPEVVNCHYTTGTYSMFVKVVCRDTHHLKEVLHDTIQPIEGISRTETLVSLEESINRPLQIGLPTTNP